MQENNAEKVVEIDARYNDELRLQQIEEQADQIRFERTRRWWFLALALVGFSSLAIVGVFFLRLREANRRTQEQADRLERIDAAKSRLFANISHELRTPLTLIMGPLSHLLAGLKANQIDKEKTLQKLRLMSRNGNALLRLVEDILDLSRLDADKIKLVEEPTSVAFFFQRNFSVFQPLLQSKELRHQLTLDLHTDNLNVLMDRKRIEQVLNNFMSNAIKFTPKGGKVDLFIREKDDMLSLEVSDTGKGIDPRDLPHVFDRFYQQNYGGDVLEGGAGIGLALVNEFAVMMKGRAFAESTPGEGSTFVFSWPKKLAEVSLPTEADEPLTAVVEEEPSLGQISDYKVLLVEDNEDMRQFITEVLAEEGYEVIQAGNGKEGLEALERDDPEVQLIVTDIMMPEMDGLTMIKRIKEHPEWSSIPVIVLTTLAEERDKLAALTVGVDDYLTKPFSVRELQIRANYLLANYLERREAFLEESDESTTTEGGPPAKPTLVQNDHDWIQQKMLLVENSLGSNLMTIEELANRSGMSTRQLARKLKLITGLTPAKFIREIQLLTARRALEDHTAMNISEVAYKCGFEHASTFSTLFKKRFGISPSEYIDGPGAEE